MFVSANAVQCAVVAVTSGTIPGVQRDQSRAARGHRQAGGTSSGRFRRRAVGLRIDVKGSFSEGAKVSKLQDTIKKRRFDGDGVRSPNATLTPRARSSPTLAESNTAALLGSSSGTSTDESSMDQQSTHAQRIHRPRRQRGVASGDSLDPVNAIADARRELRRRNWSAAERTLQALVEAEPSNGRAWLLLTQLYAYRVRDWSKARATFAAAIAHNPTNTRLMHAFAMFEERCNGDLNAARALFDQALKIDPLDGVIWQAYALLEERAGFSARARQLFTAGIEHDPQNVFLLQAYGMYHLRKGEHKDACAYFERAIATNRRHVPSWQAYGIALSKQGDWEGAVAKFEEALRLDPVSVPTLQAYGIAEARQGHYELARSLFERAAQLWPAHIPVYHAWATMEDRLGNHEEARQIFERGILAAGSRANYERRVWSEMESPVNADPMLKAWADMEQRLGHISPAPEWNVYRGSQRDTKAKERRRATIGERLVMLRKLVDRRSEEDLRAVLAFIAERTLIDRRARAAMSERSREDLERVRRWAERRNEEDVLAFKKWFEKRYEEDRLVGHYVFGWNLGRPLRSPSKMQRIADLTTTTRTTEVISARLVPPEWLQAAHMPRPLGEYERELYSSERELRLLPAMAWMSSFAENLSSRAALSTLLIGLLMALSVGFTHVYELGRNEIGNVESALLQILSTPAPQGVDAHLIDPRPSALDDRYES